MNSTIIGCISLPWQVRKQQLQRTSIEGKVRRLSLDFGNPLFSFKNFLKITRLFGIYYSVHGGRSGTSNPSTGSALAGAASGNDMQGQGSWLPCCSTVSC
jgi:hypothetical protein